MFLVLRKKLFYLFVLLTLTHLSSGCVPRHFSYKGSFGGAGSEPGLFNGPMDIAVDSRNNIYVLDSGNNRVQKFDSSGTFITHFGKKGKYIGQFNKPEGICVDKYDNIYVADTYNNRIQKFDSSGAFKSQIKTTKFHPLNNPCDIIVDTQGDMYVLDTGSNIIKKYSYKGEFITEWGGEGNTEGLFKRPEGIDIGVDGKMFIVDSRNCRIQIIEPDGTYVTSIPDKGSAGPLLAPKKLAVGPDGKMYVSDRGKVPLAAFTPDGKFFSGVGGFGKETSAGNFQQPTGIDVGQDNTIYAVDKILNQVHMFKVKQ